MTDYEIRSNIEFIDKALVGIINNTPTDNDHYSTLCRILKQVEEIDDGLYDRIY